MNRNEVKYAERLAKSVNLDCPNCTAKLEVTSFVRFQLKCPSCLLRMTIYVDEGAARVFDRQRQVEKPVAVKPIATKPVKVKPIAFRGGTTLWVKDVSKKQKGERFQKRTKK